MISALFQWLLTYLVHSSFLLLCAAGLDWRRRLTARGLSSTVWRIALFGGFISATVQPVLWQLVADFTSPGGPGSDGAVTVTPFVVVAPLPADAIVIATLTIPVWLLIAGGAITYLCVRLIAAMRQMRRMPLVSSVAIERDVRQLARLARIDMPKLRIGVRLQTPLVAPGRVICIPAWMLERYDPPRLRAALAHEIGHLRRRDNEWRIASRIVALVGWLQPLNRLAIGRLNDSAELACDAWAATTTGLHHELARALRDCAVLLGTSRQESVLTIGMATSRFKLLERVATLLEDSAMQTPNLRRAAWWSGGALLGIAMTGAFVVVNIIDDEVPPGWLATNGLYQSLRNGTEDVHTVRSVVIRSPEQYVYIRVTEDFSFSDEPSAHGTAVIAETRNGVTRFVRYERDSKREMRRIYKLDGRVRAMDAESERWLESMMPIAFPKPGRS